VHLAQVNIARMRGPLDSSVMADFAARIDEINAVADRSPGFVWRLQDGAGNATYLRPYDDDRILFNLSVWETLEALRAFVYRSAHAELFRGRKAWLEALGRPGVALWWVAEGRPPSVEEAKRRLELIERDGPSPAAFTFKAAFPPPGDAAA
jgi:heme-degrading monooxygenase HmoA